MTYPVISNLVIAPQHDADVTFRPALAGLVSVVVVARGRPVVLGVKESGDSTHPDVFTVAVQVELFKPGASAPVATSALGYVRVSDASVPNQVVVSATAMADAGDLGGDWTARVVNAPPGSHPTLEAAQIECSATVRYQVQPGNLGKIDHVVVVMMENRSFDHLLGYLSLAGRTDVDGLVDGMYNVGSAGRVPIALRRVPTLVSDPDHSWASVAEQLGASADGTQPSNAGFVVNFEKKLESDRERGTRSDPGTGTAEAYGSVRVPIKPSAPGPITCDVHALRNTAGGDQANPPAPGGAIATVSLVRPDASVAAVASILTGESDAPTLDYIATAADLAGAGSFECVLKNETAAEITFLYTIGYRGVAQEESPDAIMQYYTAADVPVYDLIAEHFAICDRWFASLPTDTWPNRLYALTGGSDGLTDTPPTSGVLDHPPGYTRRTIFEVLQAHGVDWGVFFSDVPFCLISKNIAQDATYTAHLRDMAEFRRRAAIGDLPAFTWLDPNFNDADDGGERSSDDHPGPPGNGDVHRGQAFIADLYDTLITSPSWPKTLFLIVYDEHGGLFDHVLPPGNPQLGIGPPVAEVASGPKPATDGPPDDDPRLRVYGVRVPALVASPWVAPRSVSHTTYDHTSILATVLHRFCAGTGEHMGARADAANDLTGVLVADLPALSPPSAPAVPPPVAVGDAPPAPDDPDRYGRVLRKALFGF